MPAFIASIDEAGDVLVAYGRRVSVGHAAAGEADLALLADLRPLHGWIEFEESFHGGALWAFSPAPDPNGGSGGTAIVLDEGVRVTLGRGAELVARRSDPASASLVLELSGQGDVHGARRVVLLAAGAGGRVRIGSRRARDHIAVAGVQHPIDLVLDRTAESASALLRARCDGGARLSGPTPDGATEVAIDLPLTERVDLVFGAAPDRMPPFAIVLKPT